MPERAGLAGDAPSFLANAMLGRLARWLRVLPPLARHLGGPVRRCPRCGRTYWPGSHVRRMRSALLHAFPDWIPAPFEAPDRHPRGRTGADPGA